MISNARLYALFCLAGVLAYLPNFFIPFVHGDEAAWAVLARHAFDGNLYENITDNKPPLLFQIHWLWTLGESSWLSLRVCLILWMALGGLFFVQIARIWGFEPKRAVWMGLFFVMGSVLIETGAFSCERVYLPLLLLALWITMKPHQAWSGSLAAGALLGAAFCVKQQSALLSLFPFILIFTSSLRFGAKAKSAALMILGGGLATLISWAMTGVSFARIWEETFAQNFVYVSHGGVRSDILQNLSYVVVAYMPFVLAIFMILFRICVKPSVLKTKNLLLVLSYIFLASLSISMGGRFYQTYFIVLLPLLVFLVVWGTQLSPRPRAWLGGLFIWICVPIMAFQVFTIKRQIEDKNHAWDSSVREVIDRVNRDTATSDRIWVSHAAYGIYWMSGRRPATKYMCFHQTLKHVDICQTSKENLKEDLTNPNFKRHLEDLTHFQPKVIFWVQRRANTCTDRLNLEDFPSIKNMLNENYQESFRNDLGVYYLRKS